MKNHEHISDKWANKKAPINKDDLWNKISTNNKFPKKENSNNHKKGLFSLLLLGLCLGIFIIMNQLDNGNSTSSNILLSNIKESPIKLNVTKNEKTNQINEHVKINTLNSDLKISSSNNQQKSQKKSEYNNVSAIQSSSTLNQSKSRNLSSTFEIKDPNLKTHLTLERSKSQIDVGSYLNEKTISFKVTDDTQSITSMTSDRSKPLEYNFVLSNSVKEKIDWTNIKSLEHLLLYENKILIESSPAISILPDKTLKWEIKLMAGIGKDFQRIENNNLDFSETFNLWDNNTTSVESQFYNIAVKKKINTQLFLSVRN